MAVLGFAVFISAFSPLFLRAFSITEREPTISTAYGPVLGSATVLGSNKTVIRYLGVPFAKAERFQDPGPPDKWTSTLITNNSNSAKICPQPDLPASKLPLMSEDCLQLNVYVPGNATNSSALAVLLWIHGGAYIVGDAISYDGSVLATEGNVIVVTASYRLGVLGFLSTNSDDLRGNYGMMDQIEAMKWVNKNIARFGGDPNKVTIFGESAGGMSVALMVLSPLASGLYQNVIIQSGTAVTLPATQERKEADLRARSFAKAIGCEITSLRECARKKTVQDILAAQVKLSQQNLVVTPVVDGYFLPDSALKLLQAGTFNKSNFMIGVTKDDGSVFLSFVPGLSNGMPRTFFKQAISNRTWIRNQNPNLPELLIYEYTDWSNATDPYVLRQRYMDINTDAVFKAPAILSAKAFVKKKAPTYFYQFEKAPKVFPGYQQPPWMGIYHGVDIYYLFGLPFSVPKNLTSVTDMKLSKNTITLWTNFAKTGNPNNPTPLSPSWPQFTAEKEEYMGLGPNMTVRSKMLPDKMTLWNELLPNIAQETVTPTTASHVPTTTEKIDEKKDKLVMILAILTGMFGALAVILLVVLIVICCKRKRKGKDFEAPLSI